MAPVALPVPAAHCTCHELFRERLFLVAPRRQRLAHCPRSTSHKLNDPLLLLKEGHRFRISTFDLPQRAFSAQSSFKFWIRTILALGAAGTALSIPWEMASEAASLFGQ